jgi:hypothetical protein
MFPTVSFPLKRESLFKGETEIPAYAGMTP